MFPTETIAPEIDALRAEVARARERERAWRTVAETAREIAALDEPDRVLQAVVGRGRALLGSDIAWIATPLTDDPEVLVVGSIDGVSTEWTHRMRSTRGRGAAAYVRRTRAPFSTPDYLHDTRLAHDDAIDATLSSEGVQSALAVPLISGTEFLGALLVADRSIRHYSHSDIATLVTVAAHAVVAIRNARLFAQTREALLQAEQSNRALAQKTAALEVAAATHDRLTRLMSQGGDLGEACRALAVLLNIEAHVLDASETVLYSAISPSMSGQSPWAQIPSTSLHIALADSRQSGRSVPIRIGDGSFEVRACAITGGHHALGGLIAISGSPMDEVAVRTLERGALVLAVILLAARTPASHHHGTDDAWFREILNPVCNSPRLLDLAAKARGFNADQTWTLALFRPTSATSTTQVLAALRRLRSRSKLATMLATELDGEFAVLLPTADASAIYAASQALLTDLADLQFRAVVSGPCNHLSEVATCLSELRSCLDLLDASGGSSGVFSADEMIPFVAAFEGASPASGVRARAFIDAAIGPLLQHDRQRRALVALSVLSFFDHGCNITSSAAQLGIHVNTLKNHLSVARTLVGSWDKAGRGLTVHLALRLARLQGLF